MISIRAIFFDVFGTLVDWRTAIAREAEGVPRPLGYKLDWLGFADAWRGEYQPGMEEVRSGRIPFCKLDVLHRRNLERFMPRFGVTRSVRVTCCANSTLAWHRLDAWPEVPAALARLKKQIPARAGLERQHFADGRSRPAQQFSVGRDPRRRRSPATTSRSRGSISPPARRSISSRQQCMMVAAHSSDLAAAAACGLRTGHIARARRARSRHR